MSIPFLCVTIQTHRGGKPKNIRSAPEAAECLMLDWPIHDGAMLKIARQACLDALEGKVAISECRSAFIDAAKEARIFIDYQAERNRRQ